MSVKGSRVTRECALFGQAFTHVLQGRESIGAAELALERMQEEEYVVKISDRLIELAEEARVAVDRLDRAMRKIWWELLKVEEGEE